jgi:hypothetical protein
MTTTIIALALALAINPPPSKPQFDVATAEVERWDSSSHLLIYDEQGELSASLVIWGEPGEPLRLDANFADGVHLFAVIADGELVEIESDDADEVASRMAVIDDFLANQPDQVPTGWLTCAAKTAATVYYCAAANPVLCISGTVLAACDCIPLILGKGECF